MAITSKVFKLLLSLLIGSSYAYGATESFIKLADLQLVDLSQKVHMQIMECSQEQDDKIYRDCVSLNALKLILSRPDRNDGVVQPLFKEVFFKLDDEDRVEALNTIARSARNDLEKDEANHEFKATAYQVILNLIKQIQMQENIQKYQPVLQTLSSSGFEPETDFINYRKRHGGPFTYSLKELITNSNL